jgi:hypothetical protein
VSLIGDGHGPIVEALRAQPGVVESADAIGEPLDCIFTGSAAPDVATIERTLDSGKFVALVAPTDDGLAALYEATGSTARPGALALAIRKHDGGFRTLVIADTKATSGVITRGSSKPPPVPAPSAPDYEAHARALLAGPADVGADPSWNPPAGATWGYTTEQIHSNMGLGCELLNGHDASQMQTFVEGGSVDYYVYYVDGEPGEPYYYAVQRITHQVDPGGLVQNDVNIRAWANVRTRFRNIQPPTTPSGQPLGSGLTLVSVSPSGIQTDSVTAEISQQMTLVVAVPPGRDAQAFTASETRQTLIPGWTAYDDSTLGTQEPVTVLCQTTPWTVGHDYPCVWPPWDVVIDDPAMDEMVGGHDDAVNGLPDTSTTPLTYYAYVVWRFDHSLIDPSGANGRGCPVQFHDERRYLAMLLTSRGGSNDWQDQMSVCEGYPSGGLTMDLGAVALKSH